MGAGFRLSLSRLVGWLADLRLPVMLRAPVLGAYCRATGADPSEASLGLHGYASLSAFFVRRLREGARPLEEGCVSPCDGRVQASGHVRSGMLIQAKGREYAVEDLLAGAARAEELEGAFALTVYLSPRDYHRVHAPLEGELTEVRWVPGDRRSVAPRVLARRERVLPTNERAVLRFDGAGGPWFVVMVGALNVGRIRVVGVEPGESPARPTRFERGEELARFEMGSTVVLVLPAGRVEPVPELDPGRALRLGTRIGSLIEG